MLFSTKAARWARPNRPKNCWKAGRKLTWYILGGRAPAHQILSLSAARLCLQTADCIIYAGSLVNPALLGLAKADCTIYNSAEMTLEQVLAVMRKTKHRTKSRCACTRATHLPVRCHPRQMDALDADGIPYDDTPACPVFAGAAAA